MELNKDYLKQIWDSVWEEGIPELDMQKRYFTEPEGVSSALEIIVSAKLQIIKSVATIAVAFVMKLPADLDNIKFSCETPIPKAPPSDFCIKTSNTKITASMMLITNNIVSMAI